MRAALSLFVMCWLIEGCEPTEPERKLILHLSSEFPTYHFEHFPEVIDNYMELHLTKSRIDSMEIETIFKRALELSTDSLGNRTVNFTHLIVYDSIDQYLFTVVDSSGVALILQDPVHN